jgi:uncharacterized protein YbdZ (MbtH family)
VVNHEEQYSIWPERREIPRGWTSTGVTGPKDECLKYIDSTWTDMRPLSLRRAMEEAAAAPKIESESDVAESVEDSLPVRLSQGPQPVELILRPERSVDALLRQIEAEYVHVRFTGTRGGTELGVTLDPGTAERLKAQVSGSEGTVKVVGQLVLDSIPVRCVADIDLATLAGVGKLELVSA